jgi:hypothetical protein
MTSLNQMLFAYTRRDYPFFFDPSSKSYMRNIQQSTCFRYGKQLLACQLREIYRCSNLSCNSSLNFGDLDFFVPCCMLPTTATASMRTVLCLGGSCYEFAFAEFADSFNPDITAHCVWVFSVSVTRLKFQ